MTHDAAKKQFTIDNVANFDALRIDADSLHHSVSEPIINLCNFKRRYLANRKSLVAESMHI